MCVPPCDDGGGSGVIRLCLASCDGGIALSSLRRPLFYAESAACLLERGRAKAYLASGVLELEVEEARDRLMVHANMSRQRSRIHVLNFLARKEQARPPHVRHLRRGGGGSLCALETFEATSAESLERYAR